MVTAASSPRVFASKPFARFTRKFGISDDELWGTVTGAFDADLGGGVFKYRLARSGEGTSGGGRAIVAAKIGARYVLMFGFEKKDMANIKSDELKAFRKAAGIYLGYSEADMTKIVRSKILIEIKPEAGKGDKHGKGI